MVRPAIWWLAIVLLLAGAIVVSGPAAADEVGQATPALGGDLPDGLEVTSTETPVAPAPDEADTWNGETPADPAVAATPTPLPAPMAQSPAGLPTALAMRPPPTTGT